MPLIIPLRKEIESYDDKLIGRVTKRQIIWGGVAAGMSVGVFVITNLLGIPQVIASWIYIFIGIPPIMIGFWKPKSGEAPELWFRQQLTHYLGKNTWEYISESPYLEDERIKKRELTKKQIKHARQEPEHPRHKR